MHADSALGEISSYDAVHGIGIQVVRGENQIGRVVKLDAQRTAKRGIWKRAGLSIRPLPFARFKASRIAKEQMNVPQLVPMRAQERAEARAHAGRVQDHVPARVPGDFETAMQFVKDAVSAAALIMRQLGTNGI